MFREFKTKKIQSLLMLLVFSLVSVLLYIGLSIPNQTSTFDVMMERANGSHSLVLMDYNENLELPSDVNIEDIYYSYGTLGTIEYETTDDTSIDPAFIVEFNNHEQDLLFIDESDYVKGPEVDEIYINYNFSNNQSVYKGDEVSLNIEGVKYTFTVKEVVVDAHFTTPFMSPDRIFIHEDFYEIHDIVPSKMFASITFENLALDREDYYEKVKDEYSWVNPLIIDYETFKLTYSVIQGIISAILIAVTVLIMFVIGVVIRNMIMQVILTQYKKIGVMKATGYSNHQIRFSYIKNYIVLAFTGGILGVLIGYPLRKIATEALSGNLQLSLETPLDIYSLVTPLVMVLVVGLLTYVISRKASKVSPAQAIKYGMPESKFSQRGFDITNSSLSLTFMLSIKQLLRSNKSIAVLIMIVLLTFSSITLANIGHTMANSNHFASYLLGMKIGDFAVNADNFDTELLKDIEGIDGIDTLKYFNMSLGNLVEDKDGKKLSAAAISIEGDNNEDIFLVTEGRYPLAENEIILSSELSLQTEKVVGDYIVFEENGIKETYLISGIFNSVINSSYSYHTIAPKNASLADSFIWGYGTDDIEYLNETLKAYEGVSAAKYDGNVSNILSTLETFPTVITMLVIVFIIVCVFIFINLMILDINKEIKSYGIMKSIGLSNFDLIKVALIKNVLITFIGIIIGGLLSVTFSNALFRLVFLITPFSSIEMPILVNGWHGLLIGACFIAGTVIGVVLPSSRVKRVTVKELIVE